MKTKIAYLTLIVVLSLVNYGYAGDLGFKDIYPVKQLEGGYSGEVHEFEWDDTPWLRITLNSPGVTFYTSSVSSDWYYNETYPAELRGNDSGDGMRKLSYYLKLDNWTLDGVRAAGDWTINAAFQFYTLSGTPLAVSGSGSTYFTVNQPNVVPEPVSSALFIMGGIGLVAVRKYFRKRKTT